jgi:hypothetical protein
MSAYICNNCQRQFDGYKPGCLAYGCCIPLLIIVFVIAVAAIIGSAGAILMFADAFMAKP